MYTYGTTWKTKSDTGFHECIKERMNPVRPALELGVRLHCDEKAAGRVFHRFDKFAVRACTAECDPAFCDSVTEYGRHLITVSVSFLYEILPVYFI